MYELKPNEPFVTANQEVGWIEAICVKCVQPANKTQKIGPSLKQIISGASDHYEARCRKCWLPPVG